MEAKVNVILGFIVESYAVHLYGSRTISEFFCGAICSILAILLLKTKVSPGAAVLIEPNASEASNKSLVRPKVNYKQVD